MLITWHPAVVEAACNLSVIRNTVPPTGMEYDPDTIHQRLLVEGVHTMQDLCLRISLPILICLSNLGMISIKAGQQSGSVTLQITGLILEGMAFIIYPFSMRVYALRTITVIWAGCSTLTAVVGGYLLFGENPSVASLTGCSIVIFGIFISVQ